MDRLFQSLRPFIRGVVRHAVWVLGGALVLTLAALWIASSLRIDTDFAKLLPPDRQSVQALERLRNTVGGESDVAVAIQSPSFEDNLAFARALRPRALALQDADYDEPFFTRADLERDADFLRDNALYFASDAELNRLETYLDDQIEEANLEANPFFFDLEDEEEEEDTTAQELEAIYDDLTVSEYQLSPDSTVLVMRLFPSGAQTNIGFIEDTYDALGELVEEMNPQSFNPQMEITLAGRLYRQLVEVGTIQRDVAGSFGAGVLAVLLTVMLYFLYKGYRARSSGGFSARLLGAELLRMPVLGALIALPLLMSLVWTGAVAYLAFSTLNLMTSTLGLVLFGLGIDFGIHFYARYTEERGEGRSVEAAIENTFASTGQAIAVGALTTAAGLYVLTLADFRGFSEFGFIAGTGVLFALVAMTVVLPALVAVFERVGLLNLSARAEDQTRTTRQAGRRFPAARPVVAGSLVAVVVALLFLPSVGFQYDFSQLEPDYPEWDARDDVVDRTETSGGSGNNPAYVVTDDRAEVPFVVAALREQAARDTTSPTIEGVESLQERFPLDPSGQEAKLGRIAEIRETLRGRGFREDTTQEIQRLRRAAQTEAPIALEEVPDYLKKQFTSKSGEVGGFVIVYPSVGLSDGRNSIAFSNDVATFTAGNDKTYHAASTSLVAADMLSLMLSEAPWMILATFLIVAGLMWVNFRSVRWALLALVPLVVGILWMLLMMEVFGLALNFYNLVVLPAVLGIGNDAGVHIVHRYREEGRGSIWRVLRSTGEHVTMGSLTTMIGFGGLLLSFHPGLRSIGELAVTGIGATLVAALVFLPALLQWLEDRRLLRPEAPAETGRNGQPSEAPSAEAAPVRSA